MSHTFISHATADHAVAMEVCALLEARGMKCWIGPRDVVPGKLWDEAILDAIDSTSVFLLILSSAANNAPFVKNEVNRAFTLGKPILTFRVEDVQPGRSLELYLARHHWTDGFRGRIEDRVAELARALEALPSAEGSAAGTMAAEAGGAAAARKGARFSPKLRTLSSRRERIAWGVAVVCAVAAVAAWVSVAMRGPARSTLGPSSVTFATLEPPAGTALFPVYDLGVALSPDGRRVVFAAKLEKGGQQLFVRELSETKPRALPETVGGSFPFWSPDGRRVGFFADGKLKIVDLKGSAPQILTDAPDGRGGDWSRDDLIIYSADVVSGLRIIPAQGGEVRKVTSPKPLHTDRWPAFLPDGRHFVYVSATTGPFVGEREGRLLLGSTDGSAPRELVARSKNARYVEPGYLVFGRGADLFAWRFDGRSLQPSGEPSLLAVGKVATSDTRALSAFSVASSGALLFLPRDYDERGSELRWVRRDGLPLGAIGSADRYLMPRLSPDGKRIVVVIGDYQGRSSLAMIDLRDGSREPLSNGGFSYVLPVWTPDSRSVIVACSDGGVTVICRKTLDDGRDIEVIHRPGLYTTTGSVSADANTLFFATQAPPYGFELMKLDLRAPAKKAERMLQAVGDQLASTASPDGRWLAYLSDTKLFVRPASGEARQWPVSDGTGYRPRWTKGGRELLYVSADGELLSVTVADGPNFEASKPKLLFRLPEPPTTPRPVFEDVTPDGERLLLNVPTTPASGFGFRLVLDWPALLE